MVFPSVSAVMIQWMFENAYDGYWTLKGNFLTTLKVKRNVHWYPFLTVPQWSEPPLPLSGVSKLKNHRHLTFWIIESVRGVAWHFRLFLRIAMILRMLTNTYVGYWSLKENFLTALKVKRDVHWNPFFEGPKMVWATFAFEGVSKLKNHCHLTFDFECREKIFFQSSAVNMWYSRPKVSNSTPSEFQSDITF